MLWMTENREMMSTNELKLYINESIIRNHIDFIVWWKKQRMRLSTFTRMIMNIFSISTMSFESKRVFSSTKHTIFVERASLKFDTIERLKCCKHWLKIEIYIDTEFIVLITLLKKTKKTKNLKKINEIWTKVQHQDNRRIDIIVSYTASKNSKLKNLKVICRSYSRIKWFFVCQFENITKWLYRFNS